MLNNITETKKAETNDIIKDIKNQEALERAKMRLDCLSTFDGFQEFSFYYELLMSNQKKYVSTKSWNLLRRKNALQFERYHTTKALETASTKEDEKKLQSKLRSIEREIGLISKRIKFIREASFTELLKDFQDEYRYVRVNEIKSIEESKITPREEAIFNVLNSPSGTQKLQSFSIKINDLKRQKENLKTRVSFKFGYFPYLSLQLYSTALLENGSAMVDTKDLETLEQAVNNAETAYFNAVVNLDYFDEANIAYLMSLDSTDFREIRQLVSKYREFISEELEMAYMGTYRTYIQEKNKIFPNRRALRIIERKLSRLGQRVFISIRKGLTRIYEQIEEKVGYRETIAPLTLEGIFELKGALRKRTSEAYNYLLEVKKEIEAAKQRIKLSSASIDSEIKSTYQNLSNVAGIEIPEDIIPVKIPEYITIYKKVYSKHTLDEINASVEIELAKYNVTQKGGKALKKQNKPKED